VQLVLAAGVLRYFGKLKMDWTELLALLVACLSIEAMRFTIYYISFSMTYGGYNDAVGMRYGYPLALLQSIVAAIVFGRITQLAEPGIAAGEGQLVDLVAPVRFGQVCASRPVRRLMRVDLPTPDEPTMPTVTPSCKYGRSVSTPSA